MKPKFSLLARTAAVVAVALAAGCDSTPARQPRHTQTVVLSPDQATPPVEIGLVSAVKVVLPGPDPASGLVWEITSNNTAVLEQMAPLAVEPGSAGAGPTTSASFYSLRPGKSILRFFLLRPSETEAIPAAKCEVIVRVSE
jgi:predicted secreted protein